jgi:oligopeptide transport system permease protein
MIDHFISNEYQDLQIVDAIDIKAKPTSFFGEAFKRLSKNPIFYISGVLILFIVFVALFPGAFTGQDPFYADLMNAKKGPGEWGGVYHILGLDRQGYDIFTRVIYGTRASLLVGIFTTILVVILGGIIGALAGFFGGWLDALLSRITDIFFAIPFLLGGIIVLSVFNDYRSIWTVILVIGIFAWTSIARITRGAVLTAKNQEYITACESIGVSKFSILTKHILPNSVAPVIVTATVSLGSYIVTEATLSFLGIGLPSNVVSWGGDISAAQEMIRTNAMVLFWPSIALGLTVLSFILLGDAVRDALDPKMKD